MKTESFSKQVPKNLAVNILSFMATVVIGLWLTPYLLKHLGIITYGLIPLAMFVSQYVSVIVNAINMSIGRFLLIALQQKKEEEANEIFSTSLIIIAFFILIQAIIMIILLYDIGYFFSIPFGLLNDVIWLFSFTFFGFSISLFRSIFATSIFAYNRLDILRYIDMVQHIVRVTSIVILFSYDEPSLYYIGVANLVASILAIIPTLYYFKQYTPQLHFRFTFFSRLRVKSLSKMSSWILIHQVGVLLLGNIDLYLVNIFLGTKETGEYAIVLQFITVFKTFMTMFSSVFIPLSLKYYSENKIKELIQLTITSSKIMILFLMIPLVGTIGLTKEIISLWLSPEYYYLSDIISFSMLFFIFSIPIIPLFNISLTFNKVKIPALMVLLLGIINIIAIYLLIANTSLGLWSIVLVTFILKVIFSISMIIYVSIISKVRFFEFFKLLLLSISIFVGLYMILYWIKYIIIITSLTELVCLMAIISIFLIPLISLLLFTNKEKKILANKFIILSNLGW